jgi:DNA polymerase III delta subunit
MAKIFYGDDTIQIDKSIKKETSKSKTEVININLTKENYEEEIFNIGNLDLFGENILYVVNFTEFCNENLIPILDRFQKIENIIFYSYEKVDGKTKLGKFLNQNGQKITLSESSLNFSFCDKLFNQEREKALEVLDDIRRSGESLIGTFGALIFYLNNIVQISYQTKSSSKIFNQTFLTKISEKYNKEELAKITSIVYQNELRFKKGEINEEMLILHTMLSILK